MNTVEITVGNVQSRIEKGILSHEATNALSEVCSYEISGSEFMKKSGRFGGRYSKKEWDGKKRLYHKGHRTFGTGLLSVVERTLANHGYEAILRVDDDWRYNNSDLATSPMPPEWALRDYQRQTVLTALDQERGMIKVATGGGKTVIAGHIIHAYSVDTIFFVHTKDLLYQALDTFRAMFGDWQVGQIGDGIIQPGTVTVCTLQTAARALGIEYTRDTNSDGEDEWLDRETDHENGAIRACLGGAGLVFMDECHRVAAPTASNVISAVINARYRFGLSASPWRDDGADLQLEAIFGKVITDVSASYLIERGHLVTPYIRFRSVPPGRFDKGTKYSGVYEQYIVENDARNALIVDDASKKIRRGIPTLVLTRYVNHGRALADRLSAETGISIPFLSGKDDSDTRNSVINDLRAERCRAIVATTIADEGLDIKPLAGLVLAGAGKSSTRALQRVGRVLRTFPGKSHAEVTDFEDNAKYLYDHFAARLKIYSNEPGFVITD